MEGSTQATLAQLRGVHKHYQAVPAQRGHGPDSM